HRVVRLRQIDRSRFSARRARRGATEKHRHTDTSADARQTAILGKVKIQPVRDLPSTFELRMPHDINREGSSIAAHRAIRAQTGFQCKASLCRISKRRSFVSHVGFPLPNGPLEVRKTTTHYVTALYFRHLASVWFLCCYA